MKFFNLTILRTVTYNATLKILDSQAATILRQGNKITELLVQIEQLKRENSRIKEQNSRLNHFVDIQLGIKDIDYPDVIKN